MYVWIPPLQRLTPRPVVTGVPTKKHTADPDDPNPRKRPRKRYTPEQKQAVIAAGRKGHDFAREVGAMFDMPPNTVGTILFKAYASGVVYWPIGLVGACFEWLFAFAFILALRRR